MNSEKNKHDLQVQLKLYFFINSKTLASKTLFLFVKLRLSPQSYEDNIL